MLFELILFPGVPSRSIVGGLPERVNSEVHPFVIALARAGTLTPPPQSIQPQLPEPFLPASQPGFHTLSTSIFSVL